MKFSDLNSGVIKSRNRSLQNDLNQSNSQATSTQAVESFLENFNTDGVVSITNVFSEATMSEFARALEDAGSESSVLRRRDSMYAMRNVIDLTPRLQQTDFLDPLRKIASALLGKPAFIVRSLFFDKRPTANWNIRWHQDCVIAVKNRIDASGFGPWSTKAGVQHVRPPSEVLSGMVSLRLHLDDCGADNGALIVIPGGHRSGFLSPNDLKSMRSDKPITICACRAGDVLAMRPLLPHSSSASTSPRHRRVIHVEFAADQLPGGVEWHQQIC